MVALLKELEEYDYLKNKENPKKEDLLNQYHEVIVNSMITTFGLDLVLGNDKHGGHVDTIHNARQIKEEYDAREKALANGEYIEPGPFGAKFNNEKYQQRLESHQTYDPNISRDYHSDSKYIETNRQGSIDKKAGVKVDAYTKGNKPMARNANMDLDHIISAKEIHEDGGRILSGHDGVDLANDESNLHHTDRSINRSKGAKTTQEFIAQLEEKRQKNQEKIKVLKLKSELTEKERKELNKLEKLDAVDAEKMLNLDRQARQKYEAKINEYYVSRDFVHDTFVASSKQGLNMGMRQALGLILFEVYQTLREEAPPVIARLRETKSTFQEILNEIGALLKKSVKRVQSRLGEILEKFQNGFLAGVLSSVMTTIVNIFFTTAKKAGKLIRELWVSIVEALKILIINPDKLGFGDQLLAIAKIITAALSASVGTLVFAKIQSLAFPLSDLVAVFVSSVVTGVMSVSVFYYMEHSETVQKLVTYFNRFQGQAAMDLQYYKEINAELDRYASELQDIPLDAYEARLEKVAHVNSLLVKSSTDEEVSLVLDILIEEYKIELPYDGTIQGLDDFMNDPSLTLVFK